MNPHSGHSTFTVSSRRTSDRHRGQNLQPSSSATVGNNSRVHDQPEPTPAEHEQAPEQQEEAEEQRGAPPPDPDDVPTPDEIHDA